jgi:hypothetical protein
VISSVRFSWLISGSSFLCAHSTLKDAHLKIHSWVVATVITVIVPGIALQFQEVCLAHLNYLAFYTPKVSGRRRLDTNHQQSLGKPAIFKLLHYFLIY